MAKRKTIGNSPFDAVIPHYDEEEGRPQIVKQDKVKKKRLTIHLPVDLIESAKNAVYWTPGLTLTSLGEEAFAEKMKQIEEANGGPFKPRKEELRGGRPPT